jgi:hypothetical protein
VGIVHMLNQVVRMTWRTQPQRARRALARLRRVRAWSPEAWSRVALGFVIGR